MSENITETTFTGKLINKILAVLKIGDAGKIKNFLDKQVKKMNRNITALKENIRSMEFNLKAELDNLDEQIEDAKEVLESSYTAITSSDVETNAKQDTFAPSYWDGIERATEQLENLERKRKEKQELHDKAVEEIQKQISEYEFRVKKLTEE